MTCRRAFAAALIVSTVAAVGFAGAASAAPHASVPTCYGRPATIVVTGADKKVLGTRHSDVIVALGKGDVILGGAGNDTICAGDAASIDGGPGNDLIGFSGNATVHGGPGNDTIHAGRGNSKVYGDSGNDVITGSIGNQRLDGGPGNDHLTGGTKGRFVLLGGSGNDTLVVRDAHDTVDGGAGADILVIPPRLLASTTYAKDARDRLNGAPELVPAAGLATAGQATPGPGTAAPPAPGVAPTVAPAAPAPPALSLRVASSSGLTLTLDITGSTVGAGRSLADVVVDWGDESVQHLPSLDVPAHTYLRPGNYPYSVRLVDDLGQTAVGGGTALMVNGQPSLNVVVRDHTTHVAFWTGASAQYPQGTPYAKSVVVPAGVPLDFDVSTSVTGTEPASGIMVNPGDGRASEPLNGLGSVSWAAPTPQGGRPYGVTVTMPGPNSTTMTLLGVTVTG